MRGMVGVVVTWMLVCEMLLEIHIFRSCPLASWPWLKVSATAHQLFQRCHKTPENNKIKTKWNYFEPINNGFRRRPHTQESRMRRVTISFYRIALLVCFMWEFGPYSTCPKKQEGHQLPIIISEISSNQPPVGTKFPRDVIRPKRSTKSNFMCAIAVAYLSLMWVVKWWNEYNYKYESIYKCK